MYRKLTLAALVAVLATPLRAGAGNDPPAAFDDAAFVRAVAAGGTYDVCLSNWTGPLTKNADVKDFAACVVAGHLVASSGLKEVAKDAGIELPTRLDDTHQKQYEAFKEHTGDDLDREFVKAMAQRLTFGAAMFARASKEAKSLAVREYAAKTLPTLQKHLETAKKLKR